MTIRAATSADVAAITDIYNHYITDTIITFEEKIVSQSEMGGRIEEIQNRGLPWNVFDLDGQITGFAYACPFRRRVAYQFVVESTVYLDRQQTGQGIGYRLYEDLIEELRAKNFRAVLGCIALPNESSVNLHEKLGFRKTGHLYEVGFKFDRWIDVGYWQLLLNPELENE